jgi:hypothetical protein
MIKKAYKTVKESFIKECNLRGEYLELKYFRIFLESLTKLIEMMLIFEILNPKKDTSVDQKELICASKVLSKWNFDDQKYVQMQDLSTRNELTFDSFVNLVVDSEE